MIVAIQPEKILRDLSELWSQLDKEQAGSGGALRACAMTLIATARDDDDAERVRRTLGVLMHEHPSRTIVLKAKDRAEFDARVFAECWKPFGSGQQICSDGLEIQSDPWRLDEVAQLLVPLRAPDVPAVLWCRGESAFHLRAFDPLFPMADKIVFDSSNVSNASAALAFLRSLRTRGFRVADLHWTRLTGWREIFSHVFDGEGARASEIEAARIVHGGASPSSCALYFAAWIAWALPSARTSLASGEGEPGLHSVILSSHGGESTFARKNSSIDVSIGGNHYQSPLPPQDDESLMRQELKILGPDPVYEKVLG